MQNCFNIKLNQNSNQDCGNGLLMAWLKFDTLVMEVSGSFKDREKRSVLEMSMFGGGTQDVSSVITGLEKDRQNLLQLITNQRDIAQALSSLAVKVNNKDIEKISLATNDLGLREALHNLIAKASRLTRDFYDLSSEILSLSDTLTTSLVSIIKTSGESNLGNKVCVTDADQIICYISPIRIDIDTNIMTLTGVGQKLSPDVVSVLHCVPTDKGLFEFNNQYVIGEDDRTLLYSNNKIRHRSNDYSYFDPNLTDQIVTILPCYYHPTGSNVLVSCQEDVRIRIVNASYIQLKAYKSELLSDQDFPILVKGRTVNYGDLLVEHEKQNIWVTIRQQELTSTDYIPEIIKYKNKHFLWKGLTFKEIFVNDSTLQKGVYGTASGVGLVMVILLITCVCCTLSRRRARIHKRNQSKPEYRQSSPASRYSILNRNIN